MDKQNVVYPCDEILFNCLKEHSTDTCCYINDHKNIIVSERSHIIWFCLNEMSRISKSIEREGRLVTSKDWWEGGIGTNC